MIKNLLKISTNCAQKTHRAFLSKVCHKPVEQWNLQQACLRPYVSNDATEESDPDRIVETDLHEPEEKSIHSNIVRYKEDIQYKNLTDKAKAKIKLYRKVWARVLIAPNKDYAVFRHGTIVVFDHDENRSRPELIEEAKAFLKEKGVYKTGDHSSDFGVISLNDMRFCYHGWVVTSHTPEIMTYVAEEGEVMGSPMKYHTIGLYGREKRAMDAEKLHCICTGTTPATVNPAVFKVINAKKAVSGKW
eukprot:CAMPEP_0117425954 /NCGR_PEP_ID=MMETSP0758-20121206/6158_1 /TAXON_ID=63605 /ORGANISM="Percolomonas cosmopolitus, Strain AE-1 (ATCC 50343)" /LENGTH=245 /DNA_ID=CAMNT_0005210819 /DNA_START=57 /DNA_END=791 /DNA_ORIENTATION=-